MLFLTTKQLRDSLPQYCGFLLITQQQDDHDIWAHIETLTQPTKEPLLSSVMQIIMD